MVGVRVGEQVTLGIYVQIRLYSLLFSLWTNSVNFRSIVK